MGRTRTLKDFDFLSSCLLERRSEVVLADFSLVRGGINFVMVRNGSLTEILLDGLELVCD